MTKTRAKLWCAVPAFLMGILCWQQTASAYVDPGTQAAVAGSLAVFLGSLAAFFGIVLWPVRKLLDVICKATGIPRVVGKAAIIALTIGGAAYGVYRLDTHYDFLPSLSSGKTNQPVMPTVSYERFERVMVIGMDGLDAGIMEDLLARNELPNFDKLRKTGCYARLRTSNPPQSPVAWTCIGTGCNPGKHGIFDFIHRDPKTYVPELSIYRPNPKVSGREARYLTTRKVPGFWTLLSKQNVPTTVIRWPNAFPPDAVAGSFFSGLGVPDIMDRMGRYIFYTNNEKLFPSQTPNKMVKIAWQDGKISTSLYGPTLNTLTGRQETQLPLILSKRPNGKVALDLDGKAVGELGVGDWSDWVPVKFAGSLSSANGIVRFCLLAIEPDFKLYASAIQVDPMDPLFPVTSPDDYAKKLAEKIGRYFTLGMPEDVKAFSEEVLTPDSFLSMVKLVDTERDRMFDYELSQYKKGLLAFVFDSTDRVQHMFWRDRDPEHPGYKKSEAEKYQKVITNVYKQMDGVVGKLLPRLDAKTALIILSDHGFNTYRYSVNINSWLVENGYQVLTTPDGRDGQAFFANVDWSKTKAYSVGFNSIYINMKGREERGIVESGEECRRLCDDIADKLRAFKDPKTGKNIVRSVYLGREIYTGEQVAAGPDLVVGLTLGYRAGGENVLGAAPRQVLEANDKAWSGDHLYDPHFVPGIFFSNMKIRRDNPSLVDIAPSVLQCFGVPKMEYMDGEALFAF